MIDDESRRPSEPSLLPAEFLERHGYWNDAWAGLLALDPEFFGAMLNFTSLAVASETLDDRTTQLVLIALHSSVGTLEPETLRIHVRRALECGTQPEEIVEVFELVSLIGIHAAQAAVPILIDEAAESGVAAPAIARTADAVGRRARLRSDFIRDRHYWSPGWEPVLIHDEDFFTRYLAMCRVPWTSTRLDLRTKELIDVAIDACAGHLYLDGLRIHMRCALECGASWQEVIAVVRLASTIGVQTCMIGTQILLDECHSLGMTL